MNSADKGETKPRRLWPAKDAVLAGLVALLTPSAFASETLDMMVTGRVAFVNASLNKRRSHTFVVDTGATETIVTPNVAREEGIKGRPGGGARWMGKVSSISVGEATVNGVEVLIMDPPQARPLREINGVDYGGILGYTFLSRFVTTINYPQARIGFAPLSLDTALKPVGDGCIVVPVTLSGRLLYARGAINGVGSLTFLVDTGSAEVLLAPRTASTLKLSVVASQRRRGVWFTMLDSVELGGAAVRNVQAVVHQQPGDTALGSRYDGIIGYPFLSHFTVVVNYADRVVGLRPAPSERLPAGSLPETGRR